VVAWDPDPALPARFESGVETGSEVSAHFDPMLAKVIVHAHTRLEATLRLANVLERLQSHGVTTNRDFLVNVLRHDAFLAGDTSTDFIERHSPRRERDVPSEDVRAAALAVALAGQQARRADARVLTTIPSGWRNNPSASQQVRFVHRGEDVITEYLRNGDGSFAYGINGHHGEARIIRSGDGRIELEVDGVQRTLSVASDGPRHWVQSATGEVPLVEIPRFPEPEREQVAGGYSAPIVGNIAAVNVEPGQRVSAGQVLIVLEAMKMEHLITCSEDGTVTQVLVAAGDQVEAGQVLLVVDTEEGDA
jgi:propionyl-CoA carboxylase alpha chain